MADPISVLGLAITVGAAGAQLSLTLFDIANTIKYATEEISEVAADLSTLSSILTQLSDILNEQQSLCKPELFRSMQSILERFKDIEDQLKNITGGPKTLKHVKWFFRRPKTKALLKKVESVKAALTLVLNIIQLAKEEKTKSPPGGNSFVFKNQTTQGNRFRKVVESVVQTNRLAIQNAQKEDEDNPTEKRRELDVTIARWRKPPNDTATWLYHLVFSSGPLPTSQPLQRDGETVVTIEDSHESKYVPDTWACGSSSEYEDASERVVVKRGSNQSPGEPLPDSHSIYWAQPSRIVDQLLYAWTNLDSAQIEASAIEYVSTQDEELARAVNEKIDDYKKDEEKGKGKAGIDSPFSSEESDDDTKRNSVETDLRPDIGKSPRAALGSSSRRKLDGLQHNNPHENSTRPRKSTLHARFDPNLVSQRDRPTHPSYTPYACSTPYGIPYTDYADTLPMSSTPPANPFVPSFIPQPTPPFGSVLVPPPAQKPPPPPAPAPPPPPAQSTQPLDTGRLFRILELWAVEQEAREKELGQKAKEEEFEGSKDHEEYDRRLEALHNLILKQGEEQILREQAAEAQRAAEKAEEQRRKEEEAKEKRATQEMAEKIAEAVKRVREEVEADAAKKAREVKHLADREIAEANAAAKAAKKAKKFAETQAANRARNEAETRAREERKKLDEDYKKLIENYKKRLEAGEKASALQQQQDDMNLRDQSSLPLRKTCIADGERRIEITEFTKEQLDPFIPAHLAPIKFYQENFTPFGSFATTSRNLKRSVVRKARSSHRDSESSMSLQSDDESKPSQKVILLPTRSDRDSSAISEVETNLGECGLTASFEMDNRNDRMLVHSSSEGDDPIWSTLFWEPPLLNPQSELLESLKSKGWKPLYLRMTEAGQTYFLGNQPVHVNFFRPHYRPQLEPPQNSPSSNASQNEYLIIGRDLVDEYVLQEFGFEFKPTNSGGYALDFRLTANDVDALVSRSFMMRETGFRREYRQLSPPLDTKRMVDKRAPSLTSESTVASAQAKDWSNWEDDARHETFQTPNVVSFPEELQQSVDEQLGTDIPHSPGVWTTNSPIKSPCMPTPEAPHSHPRPRSVCSNSPKLHAD